MVSANGMGGIYTTLNPTLYKKGYCKGFGRDAVRA